MKYLLLTVFNGLALTATPAFAQDHYVSGQIGVRAIEDIDGSLPGVDLSGELGNGFYGAASIGRRLGHWRQEVEISNRAGKLNRLDFNGVDSGATGDGLSAVAVMGNAFYDFRPDASFTPYIGAGLGFASIKADFTGPGGQIDGSTGALAFQMIGGVSMALSESTSLFADLRYFRAAETDFTLTAPLGSSDVSFQYDGYTVGAGFRVAF